MFQTGRGVILLRTNGAREKTENMPSSEKDRLAAEAVDCWEDFQECLSSDKRKISQPAVSSILVGNKTLRRIDEV